MFGFNNLFAKPPETIAAVDLGSNSFHMIVARVEDGQLQVIDRLREMVRLRAGLDENCQISVEVQDRALACLERFGHRLRAMPAGSVRAAGTNTLRMAKDSGAFISKGEKVLGHPIEIIAGLEEARLIYLGVPHGLSASDEHRLVVDIGGGSTEIIVGEGFTPSIRESLHMGCVSMSRAYFDDGRLGSKQLDLAEIDGAPGTTVRSGDLQQRRMAHCRRQFRDYPRYPISGQCGRLVRQWHLPVFPHGTARGHVEGRPPPET